MISGINSKDAILAMQPLKSISLGIAFTSSDYFRFNNESDNEDQIYLIVKSLFLVLSKNIFVGS